LEIRQANLSSEIAARDSVTQGHVDLISPGNDSSVLASAFAKLDAGEKLTPLELSQFDVHSWHRWKNYERAYYLCDDGVPQDREWGGFLWKISKR
jgi:hypothetical protein